jgi:amidase
MVMIQETAQMLTGPSDDPEIHDGTPVGIQIVGRRFQEEKLIAIAELFEQGLKI